jgi:hypothetical protein
VRWPERIAEEPGTLFDRDLGRWRCAHSSRHLPYARRSPRGSPQQATEQARSGASSANPGAAREKAGGLWSEAARRLPPVASPSPLRGVKRRGVLTRELSTLSAQNTPSGQAPTVRRMGDVSGS